MLGANTTVASQLDETADLLALTNANPFRVRAYRNAARTIRSLEDPLETLLTSPAFNLDDLPGIGKDLASKITEIVKHGTFKVLSELRRHVAPSVRELMQLPGIGPKKAMLLTNTLHIASIQDLEAAIKTGRIQTVKGFGAKSAASLARALELRGLSSGRMLINEADALSQSICDYLSSMKGLDIKVAGSLRRGTETIGDLDFVATGSTAASILEQLLTFDPKAVILTHGPTKISLRLQTGRQIDIRVVSPSEAGAALLYFTGSKAHNIELRRFALAQGLKLNEYGLFRDGVRIAGATEHEVYNALGLDPIPPELRESRGEIHLAAKHHLPALVELRDIRGDYHTHTIASDGKSTIADLAERAMHLGYKCLAITDHSQRVTVAHGLSQERLATQWSEIDRLGALYPKLRLLKGIEVDILDDGSLDISTTMLKAADWVVAAVHYNRNQSRVAMTKRIVRSLKSGVIHALAHPTGRLIGRRPELSLDMDQIAKAAADYGVALEINGQPERLDLSDRLIEATARHPVDFVLATDAHAVAEMDFMRFALLQARRGGLSKKRIVNCR